MLRRRRQVPGLTVRFHSVLVGPLVPSPFPAAPSYLVVPRRLKVRNSAVARPGLQVEQVTEPAAETGMGMGMETQLADAGVETVF